MAPSLISTVITSAVRTPVGCFGGSLSKLSATALGAHAVKNAISRSGIKPGQVEEVYMGNVLQASLGQAPATQVALAAGCEPTTPATTINKVCASGMKAVMLAAQNIQTGTTGIMVAGGMESMSNAPYLAPRGASFGHQKLEDSIIKDGLWDVYDQVHMGSCAERTAEKFKISREVQDEHAITSYKRAAAAWENGIFKNEVVPVTLTSRKGEVIIEKDEEFTKVNFAKIASLAPVFKKQGGTVTAANASTLNDGASAMVLMAEERAKELGAQPLARIVSYADAATHPYEFTIAPSLAVPIALKRAGLQLSDISLFEFNEAFSVVARVNEQLLGIDPEKCNIAGGAVALGHPIGSSGCRILVTLTHLLKPGQFGVASVCNGGGGASAVVIQRL
ncbi:hypothetical protein H4R33_001438 [Dimargaris cristalligena]|uniref:acetyl-CoA C-acetyltransferase n=1 Tax=Dimargaris cristalligena TaxID=215637 RepID=A0A4P9ZVN0_9FUNG|nr:hypothetical protein H4R33_001438 [Dimargaris cristalligena]RKP36902.1 acetyl-CoA acetyltransferase [Dimargaris cristalligena]|eukprot:RKP36902.1 acetyl-CoA acetyltransferase [Dimargaris cristalligena]